MPAPIRYTKQINGQLVSVEQHDHDLPGAKHLHFQAPPGLTLPPLTTLAASIDDRATSLGWRMGHCFPASPERVCLRIHTN